MKTVKRKFKCTGCGDNRPCFIESHQEPNKTTDHLQIEEFKCVLDVTNQSSYRWIELFRGHPQW